MTDVHAIVVTQSGKSPINFSNEGVTERGGLI